MHNPTFKKIYNEEFVKILSDLDEMMIRHREPFRARAYRQAAEVIMKYPSDITEVKQLEGQKGIGRTIMAKLQEYVDTGKLNILEQDKNNPLNVLTKVYGIGPTKAKEFIDKGIKTIEDLKHNVEKLTSAQKLGLEYYDDIQERIPRSEIDLFNNELKEIIKKECPDNTHFEIVGSYRRGAGTSGDIDVIITNGNNIEKVFEIFVDKLLERGIILHTLTRGKTKSLTIARLGDGYKARRLDIMYSPPEEYAFAVLYFTGSKAFNTMQRQRALDLGYTLNEHGIYKMVGGIKGDKIEEKFPDEKSIFKFLSMKYKTPEERSIVNVSTKATKDTSNLSNITRTISKNGLKNHRKTLKKNKDLKIIKDKHPEQTLIKQFKREGVSLLKTLTEQQLEDMITLSNNAYYCDNQPIMTDNEYDILREYTLRMYPKNVTAQKGHMSCEIVKNKVTLPYEMWSMDKIKPDTNALYKWKLTYTGSYVLSSKLDGVSALYSTEGKEPKLYTRGNGTVGQDVSHMIPYLKLPKIPGIVLRGEFIISKYKFKEKYLKDFSNPRNFVAGIVNQKKIVPEKIRDLDFVAYEVIKPVLKPSEQMIFIDELDDNIQRVKYLVSDTVTNEMLSELLVSWRDEYEYEIDGIICMNNDIYPRKSGNPEHAFAFKMVLGDQVAEAKVIDVIWTASKDGYLKPRVQVEPVVLGGVKIEYATGFNAKFIVDNVIGVGALIKLVRSGDVIPHIVSVIEPSSRPLMPEVEYKWNETKVDIIVEDTSQDETIKEKVITGFFKGIGVEGLSSGNIRRIILAGYDTVPKILSMTKEELLSVEGFKERMATKIKNGIERQIEQSSLPELMNATNIFGRGFGVKRIRTILEEYPDILVSDESHENKIEKVTNINGMAKKTAVKFVDNIQEFVKWAKDSKLEDTLIFKGKTNNTVHELTGKKYVMTGFRDKELNSRLDAIGAIQTSSVSKNTFIVLVKDKGETTGKVEEAIKLGITIMTPDELIERFSL